MSLFKCKPISMMILSVSVFVLSACSISIDGEVYESQTPTFNIETFFDGQVKAWGIVQNRSGEVVQRFIVDIDGVVDQQTITLDETFYYSLGEGPEKRVWTLTQNDDGSYSGVADDIASVAVGRSYGNAFNFTYEMDLVVDDSTYRVNFDDWFWALDSQTMMNRSYIKKFGIVLAEVSIFMQKQN